MTEVNVPGMALASGVVETIVSIAAGEVDGVAAVGESSAGGLHTPFGNKSAKQGIEITVDDDNKLHVAVRVEVYYGYTLPDVANAVRSAVVEAITGQVGVQVAAVDVYIDQLRFAH